jgi:hypothetical protein
MYSGGVDSFRSHDRDDLAVLVEHERHGPTQPLLEALLDAAAGDRPPLMRETARRLLGGCAPWALDHETALSELFASAGNERDLRVFMSCSLGGCGRRSPRTLAGELGVSETRVRDIRDRAEARVRAALALSPRSLRWLVANTRRRLGAVATADDTLRVFAEHGIGRRDLSTGALLLWLTGPYEPAPDQPGWLAIDGRRLLARTMECLAADGGVRRLVDVEAELADLAVAPQQLEPWVRACGAAVVEELSVLVRGRLTDALERVLDAHGRPLTPDEIVACLAQGGVVIDAASAGKTLRARRFRRTEGNKVALRDWGDPGLTPGQPPSTEATLRLVPQDPPAPAEGDPGYDDRSWLWVRVDADVLRGAEAPVPSTLVAQVGLAAGRRRTFSCRFGPITLANDEAVPTRGPVRAVALASGATIGDTLLLGFSASGDVAVAIRQASTSPTDQPPGMIASAGGTP